MRQNRLKMRKIIRDTEGHYIIIKGLILLEDIPTIKQHVPKNRESNYML